MVTPSAFGPRTPLGFAVVLATLLGAWLLVASVREASSAQARSTPQCFGAATRDPEHPCTNPQLRLLVEPKPAEALIAPNSPCAQVTPLTAVPFVCAFGAPPSAASGETVALLGDSHASHWRAAVDRVAQTAGRPGVSLTRSSCPYSTLTTVLPEPTRSACERWVASIPAWFTAHPQVTTVFVSEHAGVRSVVPPGTDMFAAQAHAYAEAWSRLPASVTHIIVLRDTPTNRTATDDCIERAVARHLRPGLVCSLPRSRILHRDPAASAARHLGSKRVQVVDLTPLMCSPRRCFPVIGGALVHKDIDHLTDVFAATLAPYLQRRLQQLLPGWA